MNSDKLDYIGKHVRKLHLRILASGRTLAEDAWKIGKALDQAKGLLEHGSYLPWVKKNCRLSERTARRYRAVFQAYPEGLPKSVNVADLTLKALGGKTEREKPAEEPAERRAFWWLGRETRRYIKLLDKWRPEIERSINTPLGDFTDFWAGAESLRNLLSALLEERSRVIDRWFDEHSPAETRTVEEKITDLIKHPNTPEPEREAGRAMLAKIQARSAA